MEIDMLTLKDKASLISKPNSLLSNSHDRVMITNTPESILSFYEVNANKIGGKVIVVRTKKDEPAAAAARNSGEKTLFVFGEKYFVTSYFSGTCQNIPLSNALTTRATS